MSKFNSKDFFGVNEHDKRVTKNFKIVENYPTLLRSSGYPCYMLAKKEKKQKEITFYLKAWRKITKELEPYFRNIRKGSIIKMGDKSEWEITIIKVKSYDIQAIYLRSISNKSKKYSALLYSVLECFQRGAWNVLKY